MSAENMSDKEITKKVQTIEDMTNDQVISPEEAKQINDATDFLKDKKTNDKKVNENITKQKGKLKTDIQNRFSNTEVITDKEGSTKIEMKIKTAEIQKIQDKEVLQAYINIIDRIGGTELNDLKTAFESQKNTLNKKIEGDKKAVEDQRAIDIISNAENNPKKLFETGSEADFNVVMNFIGAKTISETSNDLYEKQLLKLVQEYTENNNITEITIDKASENFGNKFLKDTWLIQYDKTTDGKEKYVLRGTNEDVEKNKADKAGKDKKFEKNVFDVGYTGEKKGMKYFDDDNGNFEGLRIYMDKHTSNMNSYLPTIMKGINEYKTVVYEAATTDATHILDAKTNKYRPIRKKEEMGIDGKTPLTADEVATHKEKILTTLDETKAKNGYANVLTDYIIKNPGLIGIYFDNLDASKLNLLGADEATRTNNYNRLLFKDTSTNTLNPDIQAYINSIDDSAKQAFMTKLGDIHEAITGKGKKSTVETVQEGFEKMIDQFGPMLFGILKFFGVSKATLLRRFPNSQDKINEKFNKEYGLENDEKTAVSNIAEAVGKDDKFDRDYKNRGYPSAKDLKTSVEKKTSDYITKLQNNSQYINVSVLDNAVKLYNKDAETKVNIVDIVDITTTRVEGKKVQKIDGIKEGQEETFKTVMTKYLESDAPWSTIATTQKQINTPAKYSDKGIEKTDTKNEQGIDMNQAADYLITTHKQLFQYLTASLFSNKDLGYVMVENELKGEHIDDTPDENTVTKLDIKPEYIENGTLKDITDKIQIQDIFTGEATTRPKKIKVTSGTKETIAVKKEINGTRTYVAESDVEKTNLTINNRVTITTGDKIEAVTAA